LVILHIPHWVDWLAFVTVYVDSHGYSSFGCCYIWLFTLRCTFGSSHWTALHATRLQLPHDVYITFVAVIYTPRIAVAGCLHTVVWLDYQYLPHGWLLSRYHTGWLHTRWTLLLVILVLPTFWWFARLHCFPHTHWVGLGWFTRWFPVGLSCHVPSLGCCYTLRGHGWDYLVPTHTQFQLVV